MSDNFNKSKNRLFNDKTGKLVVWQFPNFLLWSWIVSKIISKFLSEGPFRNGLGYLSSALLFAWAYKELTEGVNYFRKLLGFAIMVILVFGFF